MPPVRVLSPSRSGWIPCLILTISLNLCFVTVESRAAEGNQASGLPDWPQVVQTYADSVEKIASDQSAIDLFVGTVGPAVFLPDVAQTIGAKGIPSRLAKELRIQEITNSAQRLMAALAAWQISERLARTLTENAEQGKGSMAIPHARAEWLTANGPFPSLTETMHRLKTVEASPPDTTSHGEQVTAIAVSAGRLAQEASQQAMAEWWRLKTWKDRVRVARGQTRLCGTWQWVIHNHQKHHHEQKLSLLFPPSGDERAAIPGLAELVALGDTVYLRWEMNGHTQEDSLLFSKEGNRLEGTFVNSQGGWGSISGKRTASCTVK